MDGRGMQVRITLRSAGGAGGVNDEGAVIDVGGITGLPYFLDHLILIQTCGLQGKWVCRLMFDQWL
jgi:hypothetical protein